jgi:hypothetical protein
MNAYLDTEFLNEQLLSIGIVRDDDLAVYFVNADFVMPEKPTLRGRRISHHWFERKILRHTREEAKTPYAEIAEHVGTFLKPVTLVIANEPDFVHLEKLVPGHDKGTCDIHELCKLLGRRPNVQRTTRHHALDDAMYHKLLFTVLLPNPETLRPLVDRLLKMIA